MPVMCLRAQQRARACFRHVGRCAPVRAGGAMVAGMRRKPRMDGLCLHVDGNTVLSHTLYRILRLLDEQRLWYRVDRHREDTVMISVTVVGERLEIDVFEDGHVEFSRFLGDEGVESDAGLLDQLIRQHGKDAAG